MPHDLLLNSSPSLHDLNASGSTITNCIGTVPGFRCVDATAIHAGVPTCMLGHALVKCPQLALP